jgi:hypothetical protein
MINYGTDQIFENLKTLQSFQKWAASALPQNLVPPTQQQIENGVEPLNTYPASWHNFYNQQYTINLTMASKVVQDLYSELLAVLADGSVTPSMTNQNQLRDAIRNIIDNRVVTKTVNMTVTDKIFTWEELNLQEDNYIVFLQLVGLYYQDIVPQYTIEPSGIHILLNNLSNPSSTITRKWGTGTWGDGVWAEEDIATINLLITKL